MLDQKKIFRILGIFGIGLGIILILTSIFISSSFIVSLFGYVDTMALTEEETELVNSARGLVFLLGTVIICISSIFIFKSELINRILDFFLAQREKLKNKKIYLIFCVSSFFIALILGLLFTQSGSGISPDSTNYIMAGENFYNGYGFYEGYTSDTLVPFARWPPLYPLSIAAFMYLGFDAVEAARLIPILCFGFLMFPLFFLGKQLSSVFTGYLACIICLVSTHMLYFASYSWSEMPFILFSFLAVFFLTKFWNDEKNRYKLLFAGSLFSSFAVLTRYIGISVLIVGVFIIMIKNRNKIKDMFYQILIFGSISTLPIMLWIYRNILLTTYFSGMIREASTIGLIANINVVGETIFNSLFYPFISLVHYNDFFGLLVIIVPFFILGIFLKIFPKNKKIFLQYLKKHFIVISFIFVYLAVLVAIASLWEFDPLGPRLVSPVYPFLIISLVSFFIFILIKIEKISLRRNLFFVMSIVCVLFILIQASSSFVFYQYAKEGQGANAPLLRNNQGINWLKDNLPNNATVYSCSPTMVGFRLKNLGGCLPKSDNEEEINEFFDRLKNENNSFIVCFNESTMEKYKVTSLSSDEIMELNQEYDILVKVAEFPDCIIYRTK